MTNDRKSKVFVLMPFDTDFNDIYSGFLKVALEEAGFEVLRADDMQSQRNILQDVLDGIVNSDLVVADLTNSNPNVYYELGIAHAAKKPVILITQSIDDIPFDLRSYRLIEYDVRFSKIGEAKAKLSSYANGFLDGRIKFGSPFTDFFHHYERQDSGVATTEESEPLETSEGTGTGDSNEYDDRGFLDHMVDLNQGYTQIAQIIQSITTELEAITNSINNASSDMNTISDNPNASSASAAQRVTQRLARRLSDFNKKLSESNVYYAVVSDTIEDSLESVIAFYLEHSGAKDPDFYREVARLRDFRATALEGRDSLLNLASVMDNLPRIERRLNREVTRGSDEIRVSAANIDRTISSINRSLNLLE